MSLCTTATSVLWAWFQAQDFRRLKTPPVQIGYGNLDKKKYLKKVPFRLIEENLNELPYEQLSAPTRWMKKVTFAKGSMCIKLAAQCERGAIKIKAIFLLWLGGEAESCCFQPFH